MDPAASKSNAYAFDNRSSRAERAREKFREIDRKRQAAGISIAAVCGRALVQPSTWVRMQQGSTPRSETLRKLSSALKRIERETLEIGGEA